MRYPLEGIAQCFRGSKDVIGQAEFPKIGNLRQVKSKELVCQSIGGKVQELDLIASPKPNMRIFDLDRSQVRCLQ